MNTTQSKPYVFVIGVVAALAVAIVIAVYATRQPAMKNSPSAQVNGESIVGRTAN